MIIFLTTLDIHLLAVCCCPICMFVFISLISLISAALLLVIQTQMQNS